MYARQYIDINIYIYIHKQILIRDEFVFVFRQEHNVDDSNSFMNDLPLLKREYYTQRTVM